jgi:hypothetical protein
MKRTKMLAIVVLALGLMVWPASMAEGRQYLTVNGASVTSITLELGQSCTVEVVSDDNTSYTDYVGFYKGPPVLGDFSHLETKPEAGNLAAVAEYNELTFYGYRVVADGTLYPKPCPPRPGVHFVFEYEAQEVGETDLKLYLNDPPPSPGTLLDSVHITVIPAPMGTAITYQGRLLDAGSPADGLYDFEFKLYPAPNGGIHEGNTIDINDVDVIDGQFVVELDFGSDVFAGDARWLEIGVRPGEFSDPCEYTFLSPRVELTPTPYTIYAETAGGDNDWGVSGDNMYSIPSGNVGIGTTSPGAKLDVEGDGTNTPLELDGKGMPDYARAVRVTNTGMADGTNMNFNIGKTDVFGQTGEIIYYHAGDADPNNMLSLGLWGPGKILNMTYAGKVGIGTTTPGDRLHVVGNARLDDYNGIIGLLLKGAGQGDGGQISMYDIDETETVRILAAEGGTNGAEIKLMKADGTTTIELDAEYDGDGRILMYNSDGTETVRILAAEGPTNGAEIKLMKADGTTTIELDAEYGGNGRIITQELQITGGSDLSEQFEISSECGEVKPGMVVCIEADNPGNLVVSSKRYDRTVAGIVSGAGGVKPGMLMGQKGTTADGEHPVALTGRVYCWADASNGPIEPGELLTTSNVPGHAMQVSDYAKAQGAIIGKAMSSLESGKGLVLVLVSLQ